MNTTESSYSVYHWHHLKIIAIISCVCQDASKLKVESSLSKLIKGRARQVVGYANITRSHTDFFIRKTT